MALVVGETIVAEVYVKMFYIVFYLFFTKEAISLQVKESVEVLSPCPGWYCGRTELENHTWSACGACERGYRRNSSSACVECSDEPTFYDWLYLGFMALLPLMLHLICIDAAIVQIKLTLQVMGLYAAAICEVFLAAVITLLILEPSWSFSLTSCSVTRLADWYPLLHNPNPNYDGHLHCTQEAVYPLYSMVFIFYVLCLICMLLLRPILLSAAFNILGGKISIYSAMYFLPILIVIHAIGAGLVYYSFPYILIIMSAVSSASFFAFQLDQVTLLICQYLLMIGDQMLETECSAKVAETI